jgi:hypothetical protein
MSTSDEITEEAQRIYYKCIRETKLTGLDKVEMMACLAPRVASVPICTGVSAVPREERMSQLLVAIEQLANDVLCISLDALRETGDIDMPKGDDTLSEINNIVERMKRGE